jgi:hypothetical protein
MKIDETRNFYIKAQGHTILPNNVSPVGLPRSFRLMAVSINFCKVMPKLKT